ncbi:hypothetical protein NDU88_003434 [Pleurodeles waltl]|uniref:Uncharacterized protein n=1 Tax=Pleurodeles waltl TaxID=8319 RepID=A0AAV7V1Q9_PLEWA|nr:hypothetical protein NDU88_003434 [Pleurodeles waltl]
MTGGRHSRHRGAPFPGDGERSVRGEIEVRGRLPSCGLRYGGTPVRSGTSPTGARGRRDALSAIAELWGRPGCGPRSWRAAGATPTLPSFSAGRRWREKTDLTNGEAQDKRRPNVGEPPPGASSLPPTCGRRRAGRPPLTSLPR